MTKENKGAGVTAQGNNAEIISARRRRVVFSALFLAVTAIVIYSWSIYSRM